MHVRHRLTLCLYLCRIHYARNVFHREAVKYAATPGAVMCVTQLYHALRQTELLSEEWKDLQTLWDM